MEQETGLERGRAMVREGFLREEKGRQINTPRQALVDPSLGCFGMTWRQVPRA